MPTHPLSILVVDDAKFSSAMIGRTLEQAGYRNVRFASSASEALQRLEEAPVSVLLADWLMPEMDGLELTSRVRQLDERSGHYTYIILLTGKEGDKVLAEAFDRGVDDFVNKAAMNDHLLPRVMAAERLCNTLHRLLIEKRLLTRNVAVLEERNLVDVTTGLGNLRYLRQKLGDSLRQVESRGGAVCCLLIGIPELVDYAAQHGGNAYSELLQTIGRRLQQLVRPLDVLARIDEQHFALLAMVDSLQDCSPTSFKRLHEGLNLKAFKTRDGFLSLKAGIGLLGMDTQSLPMDVERALEQARALLPDAYASGRIHANRVGPVR